MLLSTSTLLSLALPSFALAIPTPAQDNNVGLGPAPRSVTGTQSGGFTVIAAHSTSPIHLQGVNAANEAFYIGKGPAAYCPVGQPASNCPAGTSTTFLVNEGGASLYDLVPGGQIIYVASTGALKFTIAHSGVVPAGSITDGFVFTPGANFGTFGFVGTGAKGFVACPTTAAGTPYQVFATITGLIDEDVPLGNVAACIGFDALTQPAPNPGAYEYV